MGVCTSLASSCQECSINCCGLSKTTFDEDQPTKTNIKPNEDAMYALRAQQILNADLPQLKRMILDMDLGKVVRSHFTNEGGTQMILRSDIKDFL